MERLPFFAEEVPLADVLCLLAEEDSFQELGASAEKTGPVMAPLTPGTAPSRSAERVRRRSSSSSSYSEEEVATPVDKGADPLAVKEDFFAAISAAARRLRIPMPLPTPEEGDDLSEAARDHWTSVSNNKYLGVTAHFISDTWELKSFALTILKTEERHFAEACKEQFLSVARKWDIEGKTTTIGTDSARNMVAAIRLTRYEHMKCVAHMVQRSVTESLADSGFVNALAKACKVVGHFKHSPANAAEIQAQQVSLGKKQEPLIQDVPTRWNSKLEMVKRVSRNKEVVIAALDNQEHKLVSPIAAEWDKLQRLETLLEPCRYVTELLGGEAYVSCSVVLPSLCHLRLKMEACDEDPAYVVRFKTKFKEDLASRQEQLNNAWLQIATVLDPCFKDLKCLPKTDREEVWTTLEGMLQQESPRRSSQTHDDGPPRKKISLLQMGSDSESEDEEVQPAIQRYRAEPTIKLEDCPLRWWASHSGAHEKLASLAHKYLATPATTVPCE
ncbi:zinc finger BED domain-containing protein 4-like [Esox lucius]|uniref:zinc finger BED domain-containing protein 4-like n=1 Tax=Esox lucius TaxID=8010 RepID=UPI001476AAEE|nr:zinc finger BED domain-containing protein 4-like [Esox lucius]